jgi:hypothetical protein
MMGWAIRGARRMRQDTPAIAPVPPRALLLLLLLLLSQDASVPISLLADMNISIILVIIVILSLCQPTTLQAVADIIRTTLGPRAMLKMLLGECRAAVAIPPVGRFVGRSGLFDDDGDEEDGGHDGRGLLSIRSID